MGKSSLKSWVICGAGVMASLGLAATSSVSAGASTTNSIPHGGTMTWVLPIGSLVDNFNPWSPSNTLVAGILSEIYEPMFYYNTLTEQVTPKLGVKSSYSADHKTLTIDLRRGVKWSDGQPFTSADVVFTLNMILSHPGLDLNGLKGFVTSVTAPNKYTVIVKLNQANNLAAYYVDGQTPIVPAHIWSKVADPVKYAATNPVTTGPFLLGTYSASMIVLKRNPSYWDQGKPYIDEIDFPLIKTPYGLEWMDNGKFDAANDFLPDAQKVFLRFNSQQFHQWLPPIADSYLFTNDSKYPLNLSSFRKALSYAIDRVKVGKIGEYGYETPANSVGLPDFSGMSSHIAHALLSQYPITYDPNKAKAILKSAGFKWDKSGNLLDPHGKPVSLTLITPGLWPDYDTDVSLIVQDWKAIGINAIAKTPAMSTVTSQLANGNFDVAMYYSASGASPIITYNAILNSQLIGNSNYERWKDPATDRLLSQYLATFGSKQQQSILDKLETIMAEQMPVIPMLDAVGWEQYNTQRLVGWPDATNPYAAFSTAIDDMYIWTQVHKP